ncbi:gamma-glutamyltransferase family protein [Ancylobacter lacus]|uniref:gamma-glutamyltransferase family protein n=1 Tax=Ancylobacter lacus TaxID=2579970 RepID=UPI001BD05D14|nr:gamma-glutamyltransferase family protein [Ancylobacter lacus]MBS7537344.1 gamma-glutamyltransferase family protein [Ancylobacter lacus]
MTQSRGPAWPHLDFYEDFPLLAGYRPVLGDQGMVSSPHAAASAIGRDVLRAGGNAVDAAIATSAALMVACPMQGGPGGDAFWLIATPEGEVRALDASGRAPARADVAELRRLGHAAIPPRSGFAVTVPGAVDGWQKAHEAFGSRPLGDLLEPAARLAEAGPIVSRHLHASFKVCEAELATSGALALWGGRSPRRHERLRQPALARLLRRIGEEGAAGFYRGEMAGAIARAVQAAGGWLNEGDLAAHASDWVAPIEGRFRDITVLTLPPSTQGFGLLAALARIDALLAADADRFSPATVHLEIEAVAAALAARDLFNDDRARLTRRVETLWSQAAIAEFTAGFDPTGRGASRQDSAGRITRGDTAHLGVMDRQGMAVSLIQSLFFDFGACVAVPEGGFVLQNRGASFRLDGDVARLEPGMRPPTTLMPSLLFRQGHLSHVLGCMGGDGQMQTQVQLILDMCVAGLDPQQAVSRPRWYLDRAAGEGPRLVVEAGVDAALVEALRARGHEVERTGPLQDLMGHAQVIACEEGGVLAGAADPRSDGQVAAV